MSQTLNQSDVVVGPITRAQYMHLSSQARARGGSAAAGHVHRAYYAQFVTEKTRRAVGQTFGIPRLVATFAQDSAFNTIALSEWDALCIELLDNDPRRRRSAQGARSGRFRARLPFNREAFAAADIQGPSRANLVCIAKEAARQLVEEAETEGEPPRV